MFAHAANIHLRNVTRAGDAEHAVILLVHKFQK